MDPSLIDKLVSVKGIVIRVGDVVPEMNFAFFRCIKCEHEENVSLERGKVLEPDFCQNCKNKGTFQMVHNRCTFSDKQHIKLQETPESVPEGETPQTMHIVAH